MQTETVPANCTSLYADLFILRPNTHWARRQRSMSGYGQPSPTTPRNGAAAYSLLPPLGVSPASRITKTPNKASVAMLTIIALTAIVAGRTDHNNWITLLPLNVAHQRGYGDIFVNLGSMHANRLPIGRHCWRCSGMASRNHGNHARCADISRPSAKMKSRAPASIVTLTACGSTRSAKSAG